MYQVAENVYDVAFTFDYQFANLDELNLLRLSMGIIRPWTRNRRTFLTGGVRI